MTNKETKSETFRRLATKRTNAVIDKIRILGHCANPWLYEYTDDDVKRIFKAIDSEMKTVKSKFQNSSKSQFHL